MKDTVAIESADQPGGGTVPGLLPRVLLAAVPVLSLGVLGAVPSLVIAWRRGARADWLAALVFTSVTVGWWFQIALAPEETHGWQFGADALLLSLSTVGAALHCLLVKRLLAEPR
ncbi:hypothetical protein J7E99_00295 [Streptomyces sp. ISL-44]|uniref:hypothetical protein n=1 Tax=unclassified Streptomyces TaxID=2593676 RepID=UPI001BEAB789|nr:MULTISPECIES: hypothetical protein [unclassified Streptomyces]MBT2539181.1 hypothetical protein [Streptomyces sp. ISL-44]UUU41674.1 hypothetical protein JIW86_24350 [Streptomyces sp. NBC_00162]